MIMVFLVLLAFLLGVLFGGYVCKPEPLGVIRVARSEEDNETYLFLELATTVESVVSKKFVTFEVSQKEQAL